MDRLKKVDKGGGEKGEKQKSTQLSALFSIYYGGADRDRTDDLLNAMRNFVK